MPLQVGRPLHWHGAWLLVRQAEVDVDRTEQPHIRTRGAAAQRLPSESVQYLHDARMLSSIAPGDPRHRRSVRNSTTRQSRVVLQILPRPVAITGMRSMPIATKFAPVISTFDASAEPALRVGPFVCSSQIPMMSEIATTPLKHNNGGSAHRIDLLGCGRQ